jgi:hypothetical protein
LERREFGFLFLFFGFEAFAQIIFMVTGKIKMKNAL